MHWIADAICLRGLDDVESVRAFMDAVVAELGLQKIDGYVHTFDNQNTIYGPGISGHTLIAESHVQVHTAPERGLLQLDIQSCRDFDIKRVKALAEDCFGASRTGEGWRLSLTIDH